MFAGAVLLSPPDTAERHARQQLTNLIRVGGKLAVLGVEDGRRAMGWWHVARPGSWDPPSGSSGTEPEGAGLAYARALCGRHIVTTGTCSTANISAGSKIIAYVTVDVPSGISVTGVADGASNAWTLIGRIAGAGSAQEASIWALDVPAGDVGTKPAITATASANCDMAILVQEVSGLASGNTTAMCDGSPATLTGSASSTGS